MGPINPANAQELELEASLYVLAKCIENEIEELTEGDLDRIHIKLRRVKDPRVRRLYLKFLGALGLRGMAYAAQISQHVVVTPFY
jgi:hypothetical protein